MLTDRQLLTMLTTTQLEICNVYRRLFLEGRDMEIQNWCEERGITCAEFCAAMEAMREQLEKQTKELDP